MSKYNFGEGQFVVYARNEQEARKIISQELQRFDNIKELMSNLLTQNGQALENFNTNTSFYGEQIQENAINLIAQLAIRGNISADDIVSGKVDLSEYNSYKKCDDLVKLLAVSMRNDFEEEITFEELIEQKIDSMITHKDGTQEPANTFFYGILNDSSLVENEFDKYLGKGAWRDLNNAFEQLYDTNLSNDKFELIFKNAQGLIQEFANARYQDKYREIISRNGNIDLPGIGNKLKMLKQMIGEPIVESQINQEQNINKLSLKQK